VEINRTGSFRGRNNEGNNYLKYYIILNFYSNSNSNLIIISRVPNGESQFPVNTLNQVNKVNEKNLSRELFNAKIVPWKIVILGSACVGKTSLVS
jgi:hypothetical protein